MDEVVTLIVDSYGGLDAKTKFIVHKSFVCHYSPAVKAVFENGPRYPRSHRFYNTSSNTAQLLVQWIYTQKVDSSKPKEEAAGELKTQSLVFVWALAERLQIPRLQNAVIRELQALRDRGEPVATLSLAYVYENFPPANPLRRLLVHHCAGGLSSWHTTRPEQLSKMMLADLAMYQSKALQKSKTAKDLRESTNLADYYVPEA